MSVGPFPIRAVLVVLAALVAWGVARWLARRLPGAPYKPAGALVVDALFVGLLVARAAYVALWWREYAAAPMAIIQIGDGGFIWWAGVLAGIAFALWRTRAATVLRRPVLAGIAAGLLAWAAAGGALWWMQQSAPPLPDIALTTLDGSPVGLDQYSDGPMVVNLWATWCPPCRREMPVLQRAQAAYPDVAFVLVNQGEDVDTISRFLLEEGLDLRDILRDPHSRTMAETGARALPTTLYFDTDGRLVDTHLGELTGASLADTLRRRFGALPQTDTDPTE
ncbi:prolipoprotein diacylglyceryl transferase family protein [Luteimonas dalianensis]|uniref:prolipoprotein diacylglyceryl transferase family protein n=1 Tax=Luteimonas dalianensis TaxID=1148196 RepID=UPI003BF4C059